jgi:hypothetical protein
MYSGVRAYTQLLSSTSRINIKLHTFLVEALSDNIVKKIQDQHEVLMVSANAYIENSEELIRLKNEQMRYFRLAVFKANSFIEKFDLNIEKLNLEELGLNGKSVLNDNIDMRVDGVVSNNESFKTQIEALEKILPNLRRQYQSHLTKFDLLIKIFTDNVLDLNETIQAVLLDLVAIEELHIYGSNRVKSLLKGIISDGYHFVEFFDSDKLIGEGPKMAYVADIYEIASHIEKKIENLHKVIKKELS